MGESVVVDPIIGEWREITVPCETPQELDGWIQHLTDKGRDDLKIIPRMHCVHTGGRRKNWFVLMARRRG